MGIRERFDRLLHPNKLKGYCIIFPRPLVEYRKYPKNLVVLASNEEEAILMRRFLIDEGFEG